MLWFFEMCVMKNEHVFFSLLLREIVFVFFSFSFSFLSSILGCEKSIFFHKKKHREQQFKSRHFPPPLLQSSSSSGFLYYCIQHTHHAIYNKNNNKSIHYHGVEEAGANDRALVERRDDDDDNEERHLTNFEKSSPVENYRPSVGPGVAKRPGFCGGLSRESAGVVPARERQDTKLGTRPRV